MWWGIGAAWALGGDAELGRAQGLAAAERTAEAWEAAVAGFRSDPLAPGAPAIYRLVCEAAGLGARCAAEVPADAAPWADAVAALGVDVAAQRHPKVSTNALLDAFPRHPELLTGLWPETGGFQALTVARSLATARVRRGLEDADVGLAWRSWMLLRHDGEGSAGAAADRLRALGEGVVPLRPPWNAAKRLDVARSVAAAPNVPAGLYPTERRDVATFLAGLLARSNRSAEMAPIWASFQGTDDAAWGAVHGALDAARAGTASDAATDAGFEASCRPIPGDLSVAGPVRAALVSDALLARSASAERGGRYGEALGWRLLANALATTPLDDGETEALQKRATTDVAAAKQRHARSKDPTFPGILAVARRTGFTDPGRAREQAIDALIVLAATAPASGALRPADVGEWLSVWGEVAEAAGRPGEARAAWTAATLVHSGAPGLWWRLRAGAEERDGDAEAAFASYARALARGEGVAGEAERTYHGPGEWQAAASALGR